MPGVYPGTVNPPAGGGVIVFVGTVFLAKSSGKGTPGLGTTFFFVPVPVSVVSFFGNAISAPPYLQYIIVVKIACH
jgi:hypothetical protein